MGTLGDQVEAFATTAASFSFSMLGFLVAAMALISVLSQTRAFRTYRQRGYLTVFLWGSAIAMLELTLAFLASLRLFFAPVTESKLACAVVALAAAIGMVVMVLMPVIGMQVRAAKEGRAISSTR